MLPGDEPVFAAGPFLLFKMGDQRGSLRRGGILHLLPQCLRQLLDPLPFADFADDLEPLLGVSGRVDAPSVAVWQTLEPLVIAIEHVPETRLAGAFVGM